MIKTKIPNYITSEEMRQEKWDKFFLGLAQYVSTASKDPSTKTGAVIVRPDNTIASVGYNGFPSNIEDRKDRLENRELKYELIIHCEMNAALNAREPLYGYTLYTVPFLSCTRCAVHMIQAGITRVVAPKVPEHLQERWGANLQRSREIFEEADVDVLEY